MTRRHDSPACGIDLDALIRLRRDLHQCPEPPGEERGTRRRLLEFLEKTSPDGIVEAIGGYGIALVYDGPEPGPWVMFRADMDAVPVAMSGANPVAGHRCGHDGHMAVLAGVAQAVGAARPRAGHLVLLFQPAEENGTGARAVLQDPRFSPIRPDHVYALHNVPGYKLGSVICRPGSMNFASRGMNIFLRGRPAHAAEPEKGINPARAMARIVEGLPGLAADRPGVGDAGLVTIVQVLLGAAAYGTSAGEATIRATLRAADDDLMDLLVTSAAALVRQAAEDEGLTWDVTYEDVFPAVMNDSEAVARVRSAADACGLDWVTPESPFRWSEDIAHFLCRHPGAFFGIGAGGEKPGLHDPDYEFPDALIEPGVRIYLRIADQLLI